MSCLDTPRLHFAGRFQADVSTINNDVRYYSNEGFRDEYQELGFNLGGWNPEGTGIFRLVGCRVTGAVLDDRPVAAGEDAVIGMAVENADDRVFGKLVDLDPQQQMASQIWGLRLRLAGGGEPALFMGDFEPAAFFNLWRRQLRQEAPNDQSLGAMYQSVLRNVAWTGRSGSKLLEALRHASEQGWLAIEMNVFGYGRDPDIPRYTLGRVVGTIGPYRAGEPKHFVMGRRIAPLGTAPGPGNPGPIHYVDWFSCKVHEARHRVTAGFGNCLPIADPGGALDDQGPLTLAVYKAETQVPLATVTRDQVAILGEVAYRAADWYARTGGIQTFDYSADPWCVANVNNHPLLLLGPPVNGGYTVLGQESLGGLYVRADNIVFRLEPGETGTADLYASQYGKPLSATIELFAKTDRLGITGSGGRPLDPPVKTPKIGIPPDAISYPSSLDTDAKGHAALRISVSPEGPGKPRGYIDGQLYGIGYRIKTQPPQTVTNALDFISVLAFSRCELPEQPTWYRDIQPILKQYGHLYPIMSKHLVRLDEYDSVVGRLDVLRLAFSLPIEHPNHMPVTRDLSKGRRAMILKWMNAPGADGRPVLGEPVETAAAEPLEVAPDAPAFELHPSQTQGKTAVMIEFEARRRAGEKQS